MDLTEIIGDDSQFYTDLLENVSKKNIPVASFPLSHLCFRVATMQEYEKTHNELKHVSNAYSQHVYNDRPFSIFILKIPRTYSKLQSVSLIELPSPKPSHPYSTGLEHIGFVVGESLADFKKKYSTVLDGEKDRGKFMQPGYISFSNGTTAKFYERSLYETVLLEGNVFHQL